MSVVSASPRSPYRSRPGLGKPRGRLGRLDKSDPMCIIAAGPVTDLDRPRMDNVVESLTAASPSVLHGELSGLVSALEWVTAGIDIVSIVVMLVGAARFILGFAAAEFAGDAERRVRGIDAERAQLGRYILAGLELLIVSDIIHTALSLALSDLVFLGLLVLIRSAISFFLDREIGEIRAEMDRAG
jgi:uncharacterized membrane protein